MYRKYFIPRTKKDIIEAIKPNWNGRMKDLREMGKGRLIAIFCRIRDKQFISLGTGKGRYIVSEEEAADIK